MIILLPLLPLPDDLFRRLLEPSMRMYVFQLQNAFARLIVQAFLNAMST